MKKILALLMVFASMLAFASCGKGKTDDNAIPTASEVETTESTTKFDFATDDGVFDYMKGKLPAGWTTDDNYCTSTYLQAKYGEGENAPYLTVSVLTYNDDYGASKAKALADAVSTREADTASAVEEVKVGGLSFYKLSYASPQSEGLIRYEYFGQTKPDKQNNYYFVDIVFENVKDAKQFETLEKALNVLQFNF